MGIVLFLLVGLVAFQHFLFFVLEFFLWTQPLGLKIFRQSPQQATNSAVLVANQGVYNLFLCAGLLWSLLQPDANFSQQLRLFFLLCVVVAGIYGGYSVNKRIFVVQALPAGFGILLTLFN